jgi:uncharacterized protein (DUF1810 family)
MSDPFQRFVEAQAAVWGSVRTELEAGRKSSHWMWFVFPQLAALGHSPTAKHFGLQSREEARAYLAHPVLGPRLREATRLVNALEGRSAFDIFGSPDELKFRSSMTLFARAAQDGAEFREALERYYQGVEDPLTVGLLTD